MAILDGQRLLVHMRTVEVCRELTAATAALASSETTADLPDSPAAGSPAPFLAPEDYRLPDLLAHQGVVMGTSRSTNWKLL